MPLVNIGPGALGRERLERGLAFLLHSTSFSTVCRFAAEVDGVDDPPRLKDAPAGFYEDPRLWLRVQAVGDGGIHKLERLAAETGGLASIGGALTAAQVADVVAVLPSQVAAPGVKLSQERRAPVVVFTTHERASAFAGRELLVEGVKVRLTAVRNRQAGVRPEERLLSVVQRLWSEMRAAGEAMVAEAVVTRPPRLVVVDDPADRVPADRVITLTDVGDLDLLRGALEAEMVRLQTLVAPREAAEELAMRAAAGRAAAKGWPEQLAYAAERSGAGGQGVTASAAAAAAAAGGGGSAVEESVGRQSGSVWFVLCLLCSF